MGLENQNSRTRQHSMLVIPALLSLKPAIMGFQTEEMKQLLGAVVRRIQSDPSDIVSKTGKKLVLELQKCYQDTFRANYVNSMENGPRRNVCEAIIEGRENDLKALLNRRGDAPAGNN